MSAPGGLLALHLSNRVGWAYGTADDKPDHGVWRLPDTEDHGEIGAAFFDTLGDTVKLNRPTIIAIRHRSPRTSRTRSTAWNERKRAAATSAWPSLRRSTPTGAAYGSRS